MTENSYEDIARATEGYLATHFRELGKDAANELRELTDNLGNSTDPRAELTQVMQKGGDLKVRADQRLAALEEIMSVADNFPPTMAALYERAGVPMPSFEDLLKADKTLKLPLLHIDKPSTKEGKVEDEPVTYVAQDTLGYKPEHFNMPLEELDLKTSVWNTLKRATLPHAETIRDFYSDHPIKVDTVGQLLDLDVDKDLLGNVIGLGPKGMSHVNECLAAKGFYKDAFAPANDLNAWYLRGSLESINPMQFGY